MGATPIVASERNTHRKAPPGRPFPKGVSGNPGGRPKGIRDLRVELKARSGEIVRALRSAIRSTDERVKLEAVKLALAYLYGKPSEISVPPPPKGLEPFASDEEIAEAEALAAGGG